MGTKNSERCSKCGKYAELPCGRKQCLECWIKLGQPEVEMLEATSND